VINPCRVGFRGFTLVELMIVVVVVAILALVSVSLYSSSLTSGKMTEGMAGVGLVRTALRTYWAGRSGRYPVLSSVTGDGLHMIAIQPTDLNGKYFQAEDYLINSNATAYAIRVTLPEDSNCWYEVDEEGNETKHAF